eukprot:16257-Eustigmatos_ZCMA.PRE.1
MMTPQQPVFYPQKQEEVFVKEMCEMTEPRSPAIHHGDCRHDDDTISWGSFHDTPDVKTPSSINTDEQQD